MTKFEILQIVTGFLGALSFAILYNIRGRKLVFASIGGLLSWLIFVLLKFVTDSEPIRYFLVAVLISVYAEILARLIKTPTTTFVITALIPLIPGGSLYYTLTAAFAGNLEQFQSRGFATLQLSVALALGIVLTAALTRIVVNLLEHFKRKKGENKHTC